MILWVQSLVHSPLAREPWLLARKLARRLGRMPVPAPLDPPRGRAIRYPGDWGDELRAWLSACEVVEPPPPAHRVFGQVFPREELLRLCRQGPDAATGLPGDIKLPWEFARSHHFPILAFLRGPAALPELAHEAADLMALASGPPWSCAMEVAIRAVNLVAADVLLDGALGRRMGEDAWAGWLWQHLEFIGLHLEALRITSNHYLANLLGLLVLGRALPDDPLARRWLAFARREWPRALVAQTHADGGFREASLRYHALATEMALLARLLGGEAWTPAAQGRLQAMAQVLADHEDGGDTFPVGDDDSGRVLALDAASPHGRATCLLRLAARVFGRNVQPMPSALYPQAGWWTARAGAFHLHLEFGGVGLWGEGAHAHDDDLAICLSWRGHPVLSDPGSYLYTPDRAARDRFRSAHYHSTVRLHEADAQPAPLQAQDVFIWRDRVEPLPIQTTAAGLRAVRGALAREASLDEQGLSVTDTVAPAAQATARWFFHFHPSVTVTLRPGGAWLEVAGQRLRMDTDLPLRLVAGEFAPRYGAAQPSIIGAMSAAAGTGLAAHWRIASTPDNERASS
jgi:hypothetical protein